MKLYIILGQFFGMGGGPLYIRNKVDYFKKRGWDVQVYNGQSGPLLIPELEEYQKNIYFELFSCPFFWTANKRKQIIREIVLKVSAKCYDEIIVESVNTTYALWGELIAEQLRAKHVILNMDEGFPHYAKWIYEFLDFKHKRKELAGIMPGSLARMFGNYKQIGEKEDYALCLACYNIFSDDNNGRIEGIKKKDINLGCISRLDKGYIMPMIGYVADVARTHPDVSFSFILVGDAPDHSISNKIKDAVQEIKNLKLYMLGYLSPIPNRLIEFVDYFIGTAGSAEMTANAGKITVIVDTSTCHPIGIGNYDAMSAVFADTDSKTDNLKVYLEKLIFEMDKDIIKEKIKENTNIIDYMVEFDKHMDFIYASWCEKQYFPFHNFGFLERVKFGMFRLIGFKRWKSIKKHLLLLCQLIERRCKEYGAK